MRNGKPLALIVVLACAVFFAGCTIKNQAYVNGTVTINGSAYGFGFSNFSLEVGEGLSPTNWSTVGISLAGDGNDSINQSTLATWNTERYPEGQHTLRLRVYDNTSLVSDDRVHVTVNNIEVTYPAEKGGFPSDSTGFIEGKVWTQNYSNYTFRYGAGVNQSMWYPGDFTLTNNGTGRITPVLGSWNASNLSVGDNVTLQIIVDYGDGSVTRENVTLFIDDYLSGWPRAMSADSLWGGSGATFADLDGDNVSEVIAVSGGDPGPRIYAWHHNGSSVAGWPIDVPPSPFRGILFGLPTDVLLPPAVGDVDADGRPEIFTLYAESLLPYAALHGWHANGSTVSGFPIEIYGYVSDSPSIVDLEMGGEREIAIGIYSGIFDPWNVSANITSPLEGVFVYRANGSLVSGFAADFEAAANLVGTTWGGVSTADLDGDNASELMASYYYTLDNATNHSMLYVLNATGQYPEGWPVMVADRIADDPVTADIDFDGERELIAYGLGLNASYPQRLYVYSANGSVEEGWPMTLSATGRTNLLNIFTPLAVGDLRDDEGLEMVVVGESELYAVNATGGFLSGFPASLAVNNSHSPFLADADGDGAVDILVKQGTSLFAYKSSDGALVEGYPKECLNGEFGSGLALSDLDGDGDLEVAAGTHRSILSYAEDVDRALAVIYDFDTPFNDSLAWWPTYRGNNLRTNAATTTTSTTSTTTTSTLCIQPNCHLLEGGWNLMALAVTP